MDFKWLILKSRRKDCPEGSPLHKMAVQDWGEDGGLLLKEGWGRSYGFLQRNGPESCSFAPQNHLGAVPGSLLFTFLCEYLMGMDSVGVGG